MRSRLPCEVHEQIFGWILTLVAERDLVKGERIGVDGSTMEANATLRSILRRDSGVTYREMLMQMAKESGIETPTLDDLVRLDRRRKGKSRVEDWRASFRLRWRFRRFRSGPQSGSRGHVSSPRSSNRTCGFPASGFRTRSCLRARKAHCFPRQTGEAVFVA